MRPEHDPAPDPSTNYALRLTDAVEDAVAVVSAAPTPEDSFAQRLNAALAAISQAQTHQPESEAVSSVQVSGDAAVEEASLPQATLPDVGAEGADLPDAVADQAPVTYAPAARVSAYAAHAAAAARAEPGGDSGVNAHPTQDPVRAPEPGIARDADAPQRDTARDAGPTQSDSARNSEPTQPETARDPEPKQSQADGRTTPGASRWHTWLAALDQMPPIRLPMGPPVPWRYGLPALLVLVTVVAFMSRSTAGHTQDSRPALPAQEVYPVQADGPLFATPATTDDSTPGAPTAVVVTRQPAPIGVQEPAGAGFDLLDIGIKLVAVLGLAYASLALLKKAGVGGATRLTPGVLAGGAEGMRVVGTVTLAPNRSVHALRVPDGRTLLIGATPNSVNLLTELGDLAGDDDDLAAAPGFLGGLRARLQ